VLAVPVQRSGQNWFELEWGQRWLAHVTASRPDFAKVLIRDNPAFPGGRQEQQLPMLLCGSTALRGLGVPLIIGPGNRRCRPFRRGPDPRRARPSG